MTINRFYGEFELSPISENVSIEQIQFIKTEIKFEERANKTNFKMNKTLLLFISLCLLYNVNLFAAKEVSVKSGTVSVLKNSSKALWEIDYSNAKVGDKTLDEYLQSRGEDFVKDWPRDKEIAANYFRDRFNKKNKGMKLTEEVSAASHKIVIRVNYLDMGNGASFLMPYASAKAGGCIMSGTIDIIDIKTNEVVCVLNVDKVKGNGTFSETIRLGLMYFELATLISKLKK